MKHIKRYNYLKKILNETRKVLDLDTIDKEQFELINRKEAILEMNKRVEIRQEMLKTFTNEAEKKLVNRNVSHSPRSSKLEHVVKAERSNSQ